MINWTHTETFTDPATGSIQPKLFISHFGGSRLEMSSHDPTNKNALPTEFWLPVYSTKGKSLREQIVDGSLVYLIGFGSDEADTSGRLMMVRHTVDRAKLAEADPETMQHLPQCFMTIAAILAPHDFDLDKSLWDATNKN